MPPTIELRGALVIDEMQPQFAAVVAANTDGFFPVSGETAFWLEVRPGIVVNRLLDVALKGCDVKPGALITVPDRRGVYFVLRRTQHANLHGFARFAR